MTSYKVQRIHFNNRKDWLNGRRAGIGASEASAVVGLSPWLTATELWKQKCGIIQPKDISENESVSRGNRMEGPLRSLYTEMYGEKVEYHPFDILYQLDRPWMFSTLDGELTDEIGRKGILEIKTALCSGKQDWNAWNGQVPRHYFCQILHQFLSTGYDYAVLFACLINSEKDMVLRRYAFERENHVEDMKWMLEKEEIFWHSVQNGTLPPVQIIF